MSFDCSFHWLYTVNRALTKRRLVWKTRQEKMKGDRLGPHSSQKSTLAQRRPREPRFPGHAAGLQNASRLPRLISCTSTNATLAPMRTSREAQPHRRAPLPGDRLGSRAHLPAGPAWVSPWPRFCATTHVPRQPDARLINDSPGFRGNCCLPKRAETRGTSVYRVSVLFSVRIVASVF